MVELTAETEKPDLWDDPEAAKQVMQEKSRAEGKLESFQGVVKCLEDVRTLFELAEEAGDAET